MATKRHLHEKLGLSFAELGALMAVRAMLDTGIIKMHARTFPDGAHVFNMSTTCTTHHCGAVGCIGGQMALIIGETNPSEYVNQHSDPCWNKGKRPIAALFYPPMEYDYDTITPKQAIKAIDNFLKTGKPKWLTILTKKQKYT